MSMIKNLIFIFFVSLFFAGLTVSANQVLSERIKLNEKTRNTKQLLDVLGVQYPRNASPQQLSEIEAVRVNYGMLADKPVYRSRDAAGNVTGYAFQMGGKGFWGRIEGYIALDSGLNEIEGIVFTNHNETPGLGARIEEPWFRNQFQGVSLSNGLRSGKFLEISQKDPSANNKLDGISGATMTTKALEKILNEDLHFILSNKEQLRRIDWEFRPER